MAPIRTLLLLSAIPTIAIVVAAHHARAEELNDYPTAARADYVFGCMKANGETREILQKCACSIDVIASLIPYDHYVATETILSMSQVAASASAVAARNPVDRPTSLRIELR